MTTTATASKEYAKNAAAGTAHDLQSDLQSVQQDVAKLTRQLADFVGAKGSETLSQAKSNIDDAIASAQSKGSEAVGAVREVSDQMVDAIENSVKSRPYATLAVAIGLGFLLGATWRR